jgi:hypothetical protein
MATIRLAAFSNNTVIFEADYHDGNRRVTRVRCINGGSHNARGTVTDTDGTIVAQATFLAGQTTQYNIPQGKTVTIDEYGDEDFPYITNFEYPSP